MIPSTGKIEPVTRPAERWPAGGRLLFDKAGRLWLGASGYRDLDGSWYLIFPNSAEYFTNEYNHLFSPPFLMLQSSDGRLWFRRYLDGFDEGIAWYDPETGAGCQFTDYVSSVVEDPNEQLWIVAAGNLYKYDLRRR